MSAESSRTFPEPTVVDRSRKRSDNIATPALRTAIACLVIAATSIAAAAELSPKQREFFETRIRPVLVDHCYECHNSAGTAEADLILDHRTALREGGGSGELIDFDNPEDSLLLAVIRHDIDGLEMPDGGPKLSDQTVADFAAWIKMGAPDPRDKAPSADEVAEATSWDAKLERRKQWWSFQPITDHQPPDIGSDWSNHPVDRFILAKLRDEGLSPVEPASPAVLVRRLYFNLIGLPPTAEEAQEWTTRIGNASGPSRQRIIEELVDELLASPHFGERWARHWMDWIRYAESHGSEGDPRIENAWYYRDYLIRALNEDVPYDQLLREHVAGDLLPNPRINEQLGINESAIGTAHWRMVFHGFAPTDALDEKVRFVDDQINAFSKAFLGLTVSCARCHDHKFDAISQADYYAMFGILGSCRPSRTVIDLPSKQLQQRDELAALKPVIRQSIAADWSEAAKTIAARLKANDVSLPDKADELRRSIFWPLEKLRNVAGDKLPETVDQATTEFQTRQHKANAFLQNDVVKSWDLSNPDDYAEWFPTGFGLPDKPSSAGEFAITPDGDNALTGIYPGGIYSHSLSAKLAARLSSPDFHIPDDCELFIECIGDQESTVRYVIQNYPRNGTVFPVTGLKNSWRWQRYDVTYWSGDEAHVELTSAKDAPLLTKGNDRSWFGVRRIVLQKKDAADPGESMDAVAPIIHQLNSESPATFEAACDAYARAIADAVAAWRTDSATNDQAALLNACLKNGLLPNSLSHLSTAKSPIEQYRRIEEAIVVPTRVPGLQETVAKDQPLFHRGDHKQPMDEIPRRFLEAIDATPYQTKLSGRDQLAEDLLRPDNPLTRRVLVNRVWHHLFGRGIVSTPDNFGRLGDQPTHPELLDWLALRFADDNWSLKQLIRSLVLTKTWQLSSQPSAEAKQKDPNNRLLSHANVRRLEAEAIRDSMLTVSGRLDRNVYGPPTNSGSPRRSIYISVIRNALDPFLRAFDFPEPFSSVGRRDVTNVPAQSLALLNDPQVQQYAQQWATRILRDTPSSDSGERIRSMFLTAFGRPASDSDIALIQQFLVDSRQDLDRRREQRNALQRDIADRRNRVNDLLTPVRNRLLEEQQKDSAAGNPSSTGLPEPFAHWAFDDDQDSIGKLHLNFQNGATVSDGALLLNGQGFAISQSIPEDITAKTLHVRVQLDDLNQRGGGAMTIMTPNGTFFDSIVFAEQDSRRWLAGSNNFARTERFDGSEERDAQNEPVDITLVYDADGTITGYRNGQPYGKPYKSGGPYSYKANDAIIGFGVRHLPAGGNRMLKGRVHDAQLFNRALSAEEVAAVASGDGNYVSHQAVIAALSADDQAALQRWEREIEDLKSKVSALGNVPDKISDEALWTELAQAMFTFKEFIYVR